MTLQYGGELHTGRPARDLKQAMIRGFMGRCPHCGEGKLFRSFAKTVDDCAVCGEHIDHLLDLFRAQVGVVRGE